MSWAKTIFLVNLTVLINSWKILTDAVSTLYEVGDLVDLRDPEQGSWLEAVVTRIVYIPDIPHIPDSKDILLKNTSEHSHSDNSNQSFDKENDVEDKSPGENVNGDSFTKTKSKGIAKYFIESPKAVRKKPSDKEVSKTEEPKDLLYKVELEIE